MARDDIDTLEARRQAINRSEHPYTLKVANRLFDLAREHRSSDLEDLAIEVDALAADGFDLTKGEIERLKTKVESIIERKRQC
jgi:hypothetical protein